MSLRFYGISPWEKEVLYGLFNNKFKIIQEEIAQIDTNFVSELIIIIPVQFSEEFFKWFEFRSWERVKSLLKELKRRRGRGNAIKIEIIFTGNPNVRLIADLNETHLFNSSIEKIDFVVELLPYHLNEASIPKNPSEVIYGLFSNKFQVIQEETEQTVPNFVTGLTIIIPIQFSEEFFKWFEFRDWEKVKSILKEMKRRRGRGNAITSEIVFIGKPNVRFIIDQNEPYLFNNAIEKIDFVVELLPYHLNETNIPKNLSEVIYKFDTETSKWRLNMTVIKDKKFVFTKKG